MTAEHVFQFYRAYKLYYNGSYDITKYRGELKGAPPLIQQYDRAYFYKIAHKLQDLQIHALFTVGLFFKPKAHVSEFVTPSAYQEALKFAARMENGQVLLKADLYELRKRLYREDDLMNWLYAVDGGSMPGCLGDIISGELPLDIAAMLLLIPQPNLGLEWTAYWAAQPDLGLGPHPWIARLHKLDGLLRWHRDGWRLTAYQYATEFWSAFAYLGPPCVASQPSVF